MTRMFNPAHPGEVLREFLPATMTVGEVASKLQVSRVQLSRILNGRSAVSADMAIRIGKLTGTTAESWLANQVQWDLWQARRNRPSVAGAVKRSMTVGAAASLPRGAVRAAKTVSENTTARNTRRKVR